MQGLLLMAVALWFLTYVVTWLLPANFAAWFMFGVVIFTAFLAPQPYSDGAIWLGIVLVGPTWAYIKDKRRDSRTDEHEDSGTTERHGTTR